LAAGRGRLVRRSKFDLEPRQDPIMGRASKAERELIRDFREQNIYVFNRDEFLTSFDVTEGDPQVEKVIAELMTHFQGSLETGAGFGGLDMAIWRGPRLKAVVVAGEDGQPTSMSF
jgi:hypothetical protein